MRLDQSYDDLLEKIAEEVFFILFLNRDLHHSLIHLVAGYVRDAKPADCGPEYPPLFERPGMHKRQYVPQWAKRAVFFRDRGKCDFCGRDLTGLISLDSPNNYDHIIPLAEGGINDVTNLQLLCEPCNLKKGDRHTATSSRYERWFGRDE